MADILKVMCPKDKAHLDAMRAKGVTLTLFDKIYFEDPYYDGTKWTTKRFDAGGTTQGTHMNIVRSGNATQDAATIYHEGVHTLQPSSMSWRDQEYEAYIKGEQWAIDHGLPPSRSGFRTTDGAGNPIPDKAAIEAFVDKEYPGVSAAPPPPPSTGPTPPPPPDQIIGKDASGNTVLQRNDGSTYSRPPKAGDSFAGPEVTVPPGGHKIPSSQLRCP